VRGNELSVFAGSPGPAHIDVHCDLCRDRPRAVTGRSGVLQDHQLAIALALALACVAHDMGMTVRAETEYLLPARGEEPR